MSCLCCGRPALARGMCMKHYQRWRRMLMGVKPRPAPPTFEDLKHSYDAAWRANERTKEA